MHALRGTWISAFSLPPSVQVIWLTSMPQLRVFSWLCCSRVDMDSHRFMETLQVAIDAGAWPCECLMTLVLTLVCVGPPGELKRHAKFDRWAKAVAKRPAPRDALAWCVPHAGPPNQQVTGRLTWCSLQVAALWR